MKIVTTGVVFAALTAATAALAQPANSPFVTGADGNSCIWAYQVDHTTVAPDTKSIVFHLRTGQDVVNTLPAACNGLALHGFAYVSRSDSVCAGQGIRVIETGQVCMLGKFAPPVQSHSGAPMHT